MFMRYFTRKQGKHLRLARIGVSILIIVVIVMIAVVVFSERKSEVYLPEPAPLQRTSLTTAEGAVSPSKLIIPRLGVETEVEHVGRTASGNMAVPREFGDAGWFREGYLPGEEGSAVVAGHVDDANGNPAVFFNLSSLSEGDSVLVLGEDGTLEYRVVRKEIYPYDTADTTEIFGESDKPMLNLITCDGTWNQNKRTYSERLVVFTELVESEGIETDL